MAFSLISATALAKPPAAQQPPIVTVRMEAPARAVRAGSSAQAQAIAQVAPGFHINAHHPTLNYLIPTELSFQPAQSLVVRQVEYPAGKTRRFAFSDTGLSVYEGDFTMRILLSVKPGAAPGEYTLRGKLRYQACNDHACLPPASTPVEVQVRVAGTSSGGGAGR